MKKIPDPTKREPTAEEALKVASKLVKDDFFEEPVNLRSVYTSNYRKIRISPEVALIAEDLGVFQEFLDEAIFHFLGTEEFIEYRASCIDPAARKARSEANDIEKKGYRHALRRLAEADHVTEKRDAKEAMRLKRASDKKAIMAKKKEQIAFRKEGEKQLKKEGEAELRRIAWNTKRRMDRIPGARLRGIESRERKREYIRNYYNTKLRKFETKEEYSRVASERMFARHDEWREERESKATYHNQKEDNISEDKDRGTLVHSPEDPDK